MAKDVDIYCNLLKAELANHKVDLLDYAPNGSGIFLYLHFRETGYSEWLTDHNFLSALKTKPKNINVYNYLLSL